LCEKDSVNNDLISENLGLVKLFVNKMNYGYVDKEDLYQAGLMGLFNAANHYDQSRGVKFSTFASYYIVNEIKRELRENKLIKYSKKICSIKRKIMNINNINDLDRIIVEEKIDREIVYNLFATEKYNPVTLNEDIIYGIEFNERKNIFELAKECLDGLFLKVIQLKYIDMLSQEEIANLLETSQSKVSRIEKVSLKRLKEYYYNYYENS